MLRTVFQRLAACGDGPRQDRALIALFALALLVRIAAVCIVADWRDPETWEYGDIAAHLLAGHGYTLVYPGEPAYRGGPWIISEGPTAFMAPGYTFLLAGAQKFFGGAAYAVLQFAQCAVGALAVPLLFGLTRRIFFASAAPFAALILALNPMHAYLCSQMHPVIGFTTLVLAVVVWTLRVAETPSVRGGGALGLLLGLAALVDPAIFCVAPVVLLWPLVAARDERGKALRAVAAILVAMLLVLAPWTLRNYRVFDRLVLVKTPGTLALWIGNHPGAPGTQFHAEPDGTIVHESHRMDPALSARLKAMSEPDAYAELGRVTRAYMRAHPVETLGRSAKKAFYYWWYPVWITHPEGPRRPIAVQLRDPVAWVWAPILALAILGKWANGRIWRRWFFVGFVLLGFTALYAMTNVGSNARYRVPVEPLVMAFAGAGAARLGLGKPRLDE